MTNHLTADHFDCPHCKVKRVIYTKASMDTDQVILRFPEQYPSWEQQIWQHFIVRCTRDECKRLTYIKKLHLTMKEGLRWDDPEIPTVEIQYPTDNAELPDYVPEKIARYYKEAVKAASFGLLSSASVMCRKVIYEICDKQSAAGADYKEKIKNLGFDKRITDPLLNIKNIGDETVHATGWDPETIEKAIDVLGIIIDMIYTQENRIKEFSKHYSAQNQNRNSN